ncbi:MAG: MFS transporter [Methanoregula sp.]|jgi:MFS family permease|uniref:MFS transporter n=1 Tax=Methanoregula sp. TaxID=2052170 RepID=UPI003C70B44C
MEASKAYLAIVCLGIFAVMALSNAIVPVLPAFAGPSAWQGAIYAAYFFGAFLSTLPGGILADRHGSVPVIRVGLLMTVAAGILLFFTTTPVVVVIMRGCEGIGAGLFVAAALSYVNSRADHTRMSGYYMAMLNLGLVLGLIVAGLLAVRFAQPALGIGVFTLISLVVLGGSAVTGNRQILPSKSGGTANISAFIRDNVWLWYSAVILVGITGVVSSLYPKFSHDAPDTLGLWIAGMSIATIVTVLAVTRIPFPPVPVIRWSALFMAAGVLITYVTPLGFIILGSLAGVVMIAQMAYLSGVSDHQGLLMGLFSTASYLGMAILPFLAGVIADTGGFLAAFVVTAILGGTVVVTTGWYGCRPYCPAE